MPNTMYAGRVFDAIALDATGGGNDSATSAAVRMDSAIAMSIHSQVVTTAGSINVTYTYEVSSNIDGPFVAGNTSIAAHTALDVIGFSPEASKYIRMIVTNNDATAITVLTAVLNMQEGT